MVPIPPFPMQESGWKGSKEASTEQQCRSESERNYSTAKDTEKKKKDKTVTLLFFSKHELIKNGYNYRKISLQLLFRMCCRKSMVVLDWGNDPSKGVAVKIKSMQSLWTWECPSSPHSLRENCHKATYISLRNLSFQLQTPLDTFV